MSTQHGIGSTPAQASCVCSDPEVDQLRDLIAAGIPQTEASRRIWGGAA